MTFNEVLGYDLGLLQYLWYQAMKEAKKRSKVNEDLEEALEGG